MINRKTPVLLLICLTALMVVLSGCSIQDYITGKNKSTASEEDLSSVDELKQLDEEISDAEKKVDVKPAETKPAAEKLVSEENKPSIEIKVKENDTVNLKPKASDKNKDKIIYTFSAPLDKDGKWKTTFGDAGKYVVTVTASDGELQTARKVLLIVEKRNIAPVIDLKNDAITVDEGATLELNKYITVSDPNKDKVDVKISDPVGDDGVWKLGFKDAGTYTITIDAYDGELRTKKNIKLTVNKKNMPPELENVPGTITVNEGEKVEIKPKAADPNGDKVTVTISNPVGDDGIWETGYTDRGTYMVTVKATDGTATTTKEVKVTVKPVNLAPEIIDIVQG